MMQFVRDSIQKGINPRRTSGESLILRDGRKYRTLVTSDGQLTLTGKAFEELSGQQLPREGYDPTQRPSRQGNAEYITVGGKDRITRRYDSVTNDWVYTALGKKFYSKRAISYVVKVPATFSGTRSNGQPYTRHGWFPLDNPFKLK